jgi:hypothetical protein
MTLVITAIAAIIVTFIRFSSPAFATRNKLGFMALVYWGASLMWCIDGVASVVGGEGFVELSDKAAMADDALLGMWVVILGFGVWIVYRLVTGARAKSRTSA